MKCIFAFSDGRRIELNLSDEEVWAFQTNHRVRETVLAKVRKMHADEEEYFLYGTGGKSPTGIVHGILRDLEVRPVCPRLTGPSHKTDYTKLNRDWRKKR